MMIDQLNGIEIDAKSIDFFPQDYAYGSVSRAITDRMNGVDAVASSRK